MKQCLECRSEFQVRNQSIAKFCSKECKSKYWRTHNATKWLDYKAKYKTDGRYHQKCAICSGLLNGQHKYCSDGCKQQVKRSCTKCQRVFMLLEFPKGKRACQECYLSGRAHARASSKYQKTQNGKYAQYKSSAKQRDIDFLLSKDEFISFWQKPCFYCLSQIETVGIDRIDNTKPYQIGNTTPCCAKCNLMKLDMDRQEWFEHMRKILKNA